MVQKLGACIKLERFMRDIYRDLALLFPEARVLFEKLAAEEEGHAELLARIDEGKDVRRLPEGFVLKISSLITEPLLFAHLLRDRIDRRKISLQDALELAMRIEKSGAERYFQAAVLSGERHCASDCFEQFHAGNMTHAEMIRDFMASL